MFPNPASNLVRIVTSMPGNLKLQVQIIDIAGNMMYNNVHSGGQVIVKISQLANVFYDVRAGDQISKLVIKS
jgi:hypothetical protein